MNDHAEKTILEYLAQNELQGFSAYVTDGGVTYTLTRKRVDDE